MRVVGIRGDHDRHVFHDLDAVPFQSGPFLRVVGHQADIPYTEVMQDARPHAVIPLVGLEAQLQVRFHRIQPFVLQLISLDFVEQPDASALLIQINDHPLTGFFDHLHRLMQLRPAIAATRSEDIPRRARRVHPHQNRLVFGPFALDEGHMFQPVAFLTIDDDIEIAPLGRQGSPRPPFDDRLLPETIGDQIGDRNDFQVVFFGDLQQLRQTGHRPVLVHNLDQRASQLHPRQTREIDHRLGMSGTPQHAFILRPERKDMPGTPQVLRTGGRIDQSPDRLGPVFGRHPGRTAAAEQVHRYGEGGSEQRRIVADHHIHLQLFASFGGQRCAQHPASVMNHEIDDLRRDFSAAQTKSPSFSRSSSSTTINSFPARKSSSASSMVFSILAIISSF